MHNSWHFKRKQITSAHLQIKSHSWKALFWERTTQCLKLGKFLKIQNGALQRLRGLEEKWSGWQTKPKQTTVDSQVGGGQVVIGFMTTKMKILHPPNACWDLLIHLPSRSFLGDLIGRHINQMNWEGKSMKGAAETMQVPNKPWSEM